MGLLFGRQSQDWPWLPGFVTLIMHRVKDFITINKDVVSGTPVFKGTRVPIQALFDNLEGGYSIDQFLEDFPSVSKEQAKVVIEIASKILTAKNLEQLYEASVR